MGTFMAAYLAVWLGVLLFVGRMGVKQRQIQNALDALQKQAEPGERRRQSPKNAA